MKGGAKNGNLKPLKANRNQQYREGLESNLYQDNQDMMENS